MKRKKKTEGTLIVHDLIPYFQKMIIGGKSSDLALVVMAILVYDKDGIEPDFEKEDVRSFWQDVVKPKLDEAKKEKEELSRIRRSAVSKRYADKEVKITNVTENATNVENNGTNVAKIITNVEFGCNNDEKDSESLAEDEDTDGKSTNVAKNVTNVTENTTNVETVLESPNGYKSGTNVEKNATNVGENDTNVGNGYNCNEKGYKCTTNVETEGETSEIYKSTTNVTENATNVAKNGTNVENAEKSGENTKVAGENPKNYKSTTNVEENPTNVAKNDTNVTSDVPITSTSNILNNNKNNIISDDKNKVKENPLQNTDNPQRSNSYAKSKNLEDITTQWVNSMSSRDITEEVWKKLSVAWNKLDSFKKARELTETRRQKLKKLLERHTESVILEGVDMVGKSAFLLGKKDMTVKDGKQVRGWSATVDWFLDRFDEIYEGKYTDTEDVNGQFKNWMDEWEKSGVVCKGE